MLFVCLYNEYDDADDDLLLNQMVMLAESLNYLEAPTSLTCLLL